MSDFQERDAVEPERTIEMRAADFVERRDSDRWSQSDEAEFAAWLAGNIAHRVAFLRLNASWKRTERLAALRAPGPGFGSGGPAAAKARFRVAAGFGALLLLIGGLAAARLAVPDYDVYSTPVGGRETLALRDGSTIELNTGSVVRVARGSGRRQVTVEKGEVYFQVHHDAAHPFVVIANGDRLTDLGTKFSVRVAGKALRVAMVEGRVRFEPHDSGTRHVHPAVLTKGDVLTATAKTVSVKTHAPATVLASLMWRKGMVSFHETSLADAAAEFNRYNRIKIVIHDPRARHETINGTLPINDLGEFTHMAANLFGLHARRQGNQIVLFR